MSTFVFFSTKFQNFPSKRMPQMALLATGTNGGCLERNIETTETKKSLQSLPILAFTSGTLIHKYPILEMIIFVLQIT